MEKHFPYGWQTPSAQECASLEQELARETSVRHVLYKKKVSLIARRHDQDEVLFQLDDGRVAQVHLKWNREPDPDYPWTEIFETFEKWHANWMAQGLDGEE